MNNISKKQEGRPVDEGEKIPRRAGIGAADAFVAVTDRQQGQLLAWQADRRSRRNETARRS